MASKTTTAVTKPAEPETTALDTWEGFESDGTEDIAPSFPIVKIVQATSSMQGASKHAGDFFRSDTEEYINPLDVVPLFQKNTRAIFEEGNNTPLCRSNDGIAPAPNQPLWDYQSINFGQGKKLDVPDNGQPRFCEECPFSVWGEDGTPPACRESIVILADAGDADLVQLRLGGKSMGVWRRFVSRRLKPRKLPLCSQRLTLTTVERSEPGKKWQELSIDATPLSSSEALAYNAIIKYERSRFETAVAESHENDEAPATNGGWENGNAPIDSTFADVPVR